MPDPQTANGPRSASPQPPLPDTHQPSPQASPTTNGHTHPSIGQTDLEDLRRRANSAPAGTADGGAARHIDRGESTEQEWRDYLDRLGAEDLRLLAATLPVIEQAKGIVMSRYGCDAVAAFSVLRRWSSTRNVKLRTIAAEVVAAASRPGVTPPEDSSPDASPCEKSS